jgi:hypothetical protein
MFASKQQGFLGVTTMVTAAGVLQVQSPFSAIPAPAFPGETGSRRLPLPVSTVNARPMNCDFAATTDEQSQTITDRDAVHVNVPSDPIAFH